jgi:hypothetical protein
MGDFFASTNKHPNLQVILVGLLRNLADVASRPHDRRLTGPELDRATLIPVIVDVELTNFLLECVLYVLRAMILADTHNDALDDACKKTGSCAVSGDWR